MNAHTLCFLAILGAVLTVTFLWMIAIDVNRLADAVERLAERQRER
jgi:hypothetical protein